jgi:predicted ATPase/DNA-binding SARP family transcriptional activator
MATRAPVLTLTLLGTFEATVDGVPVSGFRGDKARALLAYLAVESGRPHPRTMLAALLWPDMPDEDALGNLRKTLYRLQVALAPALGTATDRLLRTTRQAIQLNREACAVDVGTFQELLETCATHTHRRLHLCLPCLERLAQAATLYRGELLAGFGLPDAEPFEEWQLLIRERLLHQALQALYDLAAAHLERAEYEQAYAHAVRQVELDPGREEAHRQVLRALALSGRRGEALAYAERCRQMLLDTFGVEPAAETLALVDQLGTGALPGQDGAPALDGPATGRPTAISTLPTQLTPFVGRVTELLQIAEYLRDTDCRMVSILGPGGVGKTRLVIRAAEQLARRVQFADGIVFIPLAEISSAELLASALLSGLGLDPDQGSDSRTQLVHYLAPRACLLVLDNLEQLLDGTDLLVDILRAATRVRLLVTSRLPLDLRAEQRLYLDGLDYPGQGAEPATALGLVPSDRDHAAIAGAGSVQLFVQAAARVQPAFALSAANAEDILHICRLVDGMPLALELAAPWVRVMDCAAIASAIERNLAPLATAMRDVPARHRSMEAVLAQSWRLLTSDEQAALARLSVFRGPFDLDAAVGVVGVTILDLATFVDKCLLQRTSDGLYQMHELLRQFAAQMLDRERGLDPEAARERHSRYYLGLVVAREQALYGTQPRPAVAALRRQFGNIRQAWDWAAEHTREDTLAPSLEAMVRFWELACLYDDADGLLARAVARLQMGQDEDRIPSARALLIRLLVWQAHFHEIRNHIGDALHSAQTALALAQRWADREGEARASTLLGEVLPHRGEYAEAALQLQRACAYFHDHAQRRPLARAQSRLGIAHWRACEYARALEHLGEARALQEALGDQWELARVCDALAGIAFEQGDADGALVQAQEALRLYEACDDRRNIDGLRGNLALVYWRLGRFELALRYNLHDLDTSRELGDRHAIAIVLGNRGSIYLDSGDLDQALQCLAEALQIEEALGSPWDAARHRSGLAQVYRRRGEREVALAHFERALPPLRAHGAPYYTLAPLLEVAALHLESGHLAEAAALAQEAATLAGELGLEEEQRRSQALAEQVAAAQRARGQGQASAV